MSLQATRTYKYLFDQQVDEVARLFGIGMDEQGIILQLEARFGLSEVQSVLVIEEFERRRSSSENRRAIKWLLLGILGLTSILTVRVWGQFDFPPRVVVGILWILVLVTAVGLWQGVRIKKRLSEGEFRIFGWDVIQISLVVAVGIAGLVLSVLQFQVLPASENPPDDDDLTWVQAPYERLSSSTGRISGQISNDSTHWKAVNLRLTMAYIDADTGAQSTRVVSLGTLQVRPESTETYSRTVFPPTDASVIILGIEWEWEPD